MPGWHEKVQDLREAGDLRVLQIIPEQHPERTRLFMQWKGMDAPTLADPLNLVGVRAVPHFVLVGPDGVVDAVSPSPEEVRRLVTGEAPDDGEPEGASDDGDEEDETLTVASRADVDPVVDFADTVVRWGSPSTLERAIAAYQRALEERPDDGTLHFRLGVARRLRHDSEARREADFREAATHWTRALELDPNQYVWRRRIQQYGPRLDKPYAFYDWVSKAREAIRDRGDEPVALDVEPGGAELADPVEELPTAAGAEGEPDAEGRIERDEAGYVTSESVVVPAEVDAGEGGRIHVTFRPNPDEQAHWNNEAGGLVAWFDDPPEGWSLTPQRHRIDGPDRAESDEPRTVEVEVQPPEGTRGTTELSGYALYYVCEDVDGTCVYRRQDVTVPVEVEAPDDDATVGPDAEDG